MALQSFALVLLLARALPCYGQLAECDGGLCDGDLHLGVSMLQTDVKQETGETPQIRALGQSVMPETDVTSGADATHASEATTKAGGAKAPAVSYTAVGAEVLAMTLFVIIGCGSAMGIAKDEGSAWVLQVSLTFGLAITTLAYSLGWASGGHINCAVTFGLVLTGQCTVVQGLANFGGQLLGSLVGAAFLAAVYPEGADRTGSLGSNGIDVKFSQFQALLMEFAMTFLLMLVVLQTAVNPSSAANAVNAPIAIGLAVFLAHSVLIPIDGCSINPTRSFGPAVVAKFTKEKADTFSDMWVFWLGPLAGAAAAAGVSIGLGL